MLHITTNYNFTCFRWRKIQSLGLAKEYSSTSEIGQYLKHVFGLPFLKPEMVSDCFVEDFAAIQPKHKQIEEFADYLVENYISNDSLFPPNMWAANSSSLQRSTNACEAFHSKFNSSFYCAHPNIYQFVEVLKNFQIDTYVKIKSASVVKKVYRKATVAKQLYIQNKIQ